MHRCGVRKRHGHSVRSLIQSIFALPFTGKNFFRGIVINDQVGFGKVAGKDLEKTKLCPKCARQGQIFPNGSKRNQKNDEKIK